MEKLYKEATEDTPELNFNPETGVFSIIGSSYPEDRAKTYEPVIEWLKEYANNPLEKTELTIELDYFNSASYTAILLIIRTMDEIYSKTNNAKIIWKYYEEDTDMQEAGEEFAASVDIPFEFIVTED